MPIYWTDKERDKPDLDWYSFGSLVLLVFVSGIAVGGFLMFLVLA